MTVVLQGTVAMTVTQGLPVGSEKSMDKSFSQIGVNNNVFSKIGMNNNVFGKIGVNNNVFSKIGVNNSVFSKIGVIYNVFSKIGVCGAAGHCRHDCDTGASRGFRKVNGQKQ